MGLDVLEALRAKVPKVEADLKRPPTRVRLALFSRSGFTPAVRDLAEAGQVALFEPADLISERSL